MPRPCTPEVGRRPDPGHCVSLVAQTKDEKEKKPKAPPPPAYTDPAEAGPDFAVQGEYVGSVQGDGGEVKVGVQVVALGEGKFHGVGFVGGLPGDGWDENTTFAGDGQTKEGVTILSSGDGATGTIQNGVLTIKSPEGKTTGTLKRVHRVSPTEGAKPPAGAIVLFDGTTADHFVGGRMTPDGLLMEGCTSKQKFQSYSIHLEFRIPFMPTARGQGRGNSGYYSQGAADADPRFLRPGTEGVRRYGAIYGIAALPKRMMSYPPLSWQTYDIDFKAAQYDGDKKQANARITVRHNGVLIPRTRRQHTPRPPRR